MKSKKIICGTVAAMLTMSVAFSGCGLMSTINSEDMKQVVATVNIGKSENLGDLAAYKSSVTEKSIVKRDLISSFVNVGSTYVNSYGMSYEEAFNSIMTNLTENALVIQYATLYVLKSKVESGDVVLADYNAKATLTEKLTYLLDDESVMRAQYNLYSSLNSALDSYEQSELNEDETYIGTDTRTTPTGIDQTVEDYMPVEDGKLNYNVYTGYEGYLLTESGEYQKDALDNTNRNTRRRAYSRFLTSIKNNYLLGEDETELTDILSLSYVKTQYESQLEQSVISEFNDLYSEEQEAKINKENAEGVYTFVQEAYNEMLEGQQQVYTDSSSFSNAYGNFSDTSFLLYAPDTKQDTEEIELNGVSTHGAFGYVYNILLPFSTVQSGRLTKLQNYRDSKIIDEDGYYAERNALMSEIKTTDQRTAWFNGQTDYSFNAVEYNNDAAVVDKIFYYNAANAERTYLFFENNMTKKDEYKPLEKYTGLYTYNGKVSKNKDGSYTLVPYKVNIDDMLREFSDYVDFVLGTPSVQTHAGDTLLGGTTLEDFHRYYDETKFTDENDKVDYSKLVYATGMVTLNDTAKETMFADTDRYKAMSAVNELQYAYTTDTGVLSQYIGYTVSAYDTNYIKEFEYAAQQAIRMGAGAFKVCAGDYGWHLIYVTDTFEWDGGEVYSPEFTKEKIEQEGTFENKFYSWIKDKALSNETTQKRTEILQYCADDNTIVKIEKAYKDLLELDS